MPSTATKSPLGMRTRVIGVAAAAALVSAAVPAHPLVSRDTPGGPSSTTYQVVKLQSLGGTYSAGSSINDRGWVTGASNLAGDRVRRHATLWRDTTAADLGTLGGPNSSVVWPVKNVRGVVSGISQTRRLDPLDEGWSCSFFLPASGSNRACRGFVWRNGDMRMLPTLGGTNGFATGTNNRMQTVGWAENRVHDETCVAPQQLQFRAVVWGPRRSDMQQLRPVRGDTVSAATAINDRGQVVGISGICDIAVGRFSAVHAVLWEDGQRTRIGDLGGVAWNTPMAINERGHVVGFSNVSADDGGSFNAHAFLWTRRDGIRDLGTLPGDVYSQALGINERRQVVGLSCSEGFATCRAFLWERGVMTDLNMVAAGYTDHLYAANDINNAGQITGEAVDRATGESIAYRADPACCDAEQAGTARRRTSGLIPALPQPARDAILGRFGIDLTTSTRLVPGKPAS